MIGMVSGICLMAGAGEAIIDCAGVGYLVQCSAKTLGRLQEGQPARLHVETHVREQAITLYGFALDEDRAWFVRLQSVQGVGPKAALAILDILSPDEIMSAAALEDKTAFARASGVGPKLAARIATELAGKAPPAGRGFGGLSGEAAAVTAKTSGLETGGAENRDLRRDAVSALVNLGIGQSEALRAVASAQQGFDDSPELDILVKAAFKALGSQNG